MRIYKYIFPIFFFSFSVVNAQKKWTLQECIHYAFEHNLHIKQSRLEKTNQENNLKTAKKERIPSVSATVSNTANFGQNQDVFGNHRRNDNFTMEADSKNKSKNLSTRWKPAPMIWKG